MTRNGVVALAFSMGICLSECGESHPAEALRYHAAATEVLVERSVCAMASDCQRKEILFWEGGNPWLPGHSKVYLNFYEISDPALVAAIEVKLKQVRAEASLPPVGLTVYSSRHLEPKRLFQELTIE